MVTSAGLFTYNRQGPNHECKFYCDDDMIMLYILTKYFFS